MEARGQVASLEGEVVSLKGELEEWRGTVALASAGEKERALLSAALDEAHAELLQVMSPSIPDFSRPKQG